MNDLTHHSSPDQGAALTPYQPSESTIRTGLNLADDAEKMLLANALTGQDKKLADVMGEPFSLVNYVAHNVEINDVASGEVLQATRIVLITGDYERISCVSVGVLQALRTFTALYGTAPWFPPLRVVASEGKTRQGFRFTQLNLVALAKVENSESKKRK